MKEINKKSILAAFALAMMLGVAVPSTGASASENEYPECIGDDGEWICGLGGGGLEYNESYVLSLGELYWRVNLWDDWTEFEGYRAARSAVAATIDLQDCSKDTETVLSNVFPVAEVGTTLYDALSTDTKTEVKDQAFCSVMTTLKADPLYTSDTVFKTLIDKMEEQVTERKTTVIAYLKEVEETKSSEQTTKPDISDRDVADFFKSGEAGEANIDAMTIPELIDAMKVTPNFVAYSNLYKAENNAIDNLNLSFEVKNEVTRIDYESLWAAYEKDPEAVVTAYQNYAKAAVVIDKDVLKELIPIELPNTSVPDAPGAGILSMIENGSIDMGMVAIIVMAAVAVLLGTGFVAKLYLKHKF